MANDFTPNPSSSRPPERLIEEFLVAVGGLASGVGHDLSNLLLPLRLQTETRRGRGENHSSGGPAAEAVRSLASLCEALRQLSLNRLADSEGDATEWGPWWERTRPLWNAVLARRVSFEADEPSEESLRLAIPAAFLTHLVWNTLRAFAEASTARLSLRLGVDAADAGDVVLSFRATAETAEHAATLRRAWSDEEGRGLHALTAAWLAARFGRAVTVESGGKEEGELRATVRVTLPRAASGEARAGGEGLAVVDLRDARLAAYARTLLVTWGFTIHEGTPEPGAHPRVWLTDDPNALEAARSSERNGSDGIMVAYTEREEVQQWQSRTFIRVPPSKGMAALREALRRAASAAAR